MSSNQVPLWVPLVVALVGFAGVLAAQVLANRRDDMRWERQMERETRQWARESEIRSEARRDRRRQELAQAIAEYASTVAPLRRADYKRGLERISGVAETERQPAKLETYRLRAEAESKMYLVSLLSDQHKDGDLLEDAEAVIELSDEISDKSTSESDLRNRNQIAKEALGKLIEKAGRRIRGHADSVT